MEFYSFVLHLQVLKSMGVNLKDARVETEKIIGRGSGFVAVEIPFTPRAKRVLELSLEEARQLGKLAVLLYRTQGSMLVSVLLQSSLQQSSEVCCCSAGHNYIGTEHVLLGLLREGEGVAARVLETLGADPQKIRSQVSCQPLPRGGVRVWQICKQRLWHTYVWHCRSSGWLGRVRRQWAWVQAQGPAATRCPRWKSMGQT